MKKIYSFLAAALLLSATASAQVAKIGTTNYTDIASAIADWKKVGGELQLLSDAAYTTAKIDTLTKDATLDLNGKTLTWNAKFGSLEKTGTIPALFVKNGTFTIKASAADDATQKGTLVLNVSHNKSTNLCAILVGMTQTTTAKLVATDGVNLVGNFATAPTYTKYQNNAPYTQTQLTSSIIYPYLGALDIENANIRMQGECGMALNSYSKSSKEIICVNNTITYEAGTPTLCLKEWYGINIANKNGAVLNNNKVDMSAAKGTFINSGKAIEPSIYALKVAVANVSIKGNESLYKVDVTGANNRSVYGGTSYIGSIEDGTFVGKWEAGLSISGGKFTHQPDTRYVAANHYFEKDGEYYVVKQGKSYVVRINGKDYLNTDDWASVCSHSADVYTTVITIARTDFTIPEGVYVYLNFKSSSDAKDVFADITITNKGNMRLGSWWKKGSLVNDGTLEIYEYIKLGESSTYPMHIVNNATGKLFVKPSTSTTGSTTTFKDYFTLTNNGGQVFVSAGIFTEKAFAQIYKEGEYNYIANGYVHPKWASDKCYHILSADDVVATVNGVEYNDLQEAIMASSAENPAILKKDLTLTSKIGLQNGKGEKVLDLNGKTLTLDYSSLDSKQEFITVGNTKFTIQGKGTITGNGDILFHVSGKNSSTTNYTVLTVGKDVIIRQTDGWYAIAAISTSLYHGIVVNFNGRIEAQCAFYVNGQIKETSESAPTFNIGSTATFDCSSSLAYAAGYARWTYAGNATVGNFGFEIRAGEFTMNGGSIVSTSTEPADDQFNGNGSTSEACGIAVCQHGTQLPISVTIDGGEIKAYTPIYQANPQNNPQEAIDKVSVTVNNAKVYSTSNNIVWSANKKITLNGGIYNMNPSAYAAEGKVVVANKGADAETYPWTIGTKDADVTFATEGAWNVAGNWSNSTMATAATSATIDANVTIGNGVRAEAYGIKVNTGKTITIEKGGVLVVGKDGISGITTANQLIIKDGGALVFSPVAAVANTQPKATAEIETTIRDAKTDYAAGNTTYEYIWKNVALPMQAGYTLDPKGTLTVNKWNNGWGDADEFGTPFTGYHITINPADPRPNATYTFTGNLNGNVDIDLTMPRNGFHLFGNSWSAPLDVREILNQIEHFTDSKVNASVKYYISDKCTLGGKQYFDGTYVDITRASLAADAGFAGAFGTIGAHDCFFLQSASSATVSLNYEKAVWNVMLAKKSSAPRRVQAEEEETTRVEVLLTADNGRWDNVLLYEGESLCSQKMLNEGAANVNIYATTMEGNCSTVGAESLLGTELAIQTNGRSVYTLSFDKVQGEVLYLKDLATGIVTEMSDGATYTFTAEPNTTATRFRVVSRSEVTTGVEDLTTTETSIHAQGIYSVTGQYLGTADQLPTLPAGVYIINGKKVVK